MVLTPMQLKSRCPRFIVFGGGHRRNINLTRRGSEDCGCALLPTRGRVIGEPKSSPVAKTTPINSQEWRAKVQGTPARLSSPTNF